MAESNKQPPDKERPLKAPALLQMIGHTAMYGYTQMRTARNRPPTLFATMEEEVANSPQPLHPDTATTTKYIQAVLTKHTVATLEHLSLSDKFMLSARMIQFTDRLVGGGQAFFRYSSMKTLKDRFVASAEEQAYPLNFAEQLSIALDLTGDNIEEALTNLWFASRQYARWLDSVSIHDLPKFTPEEVLIEMKEWRSTILACKNADEKNFQDAAGDNYYAWTHALAHVIYGSGTGIPDRIGQYIFNHGTAINTRARLIKQSVPSDHRAAAAYGNQIGGVILDAIKKI